MKKPMAMDLELPGLLNLAEVAPDRLVAGGAALKIDAKAIQPSRWANRQQASFESAEFQALKAEIADAGGNVQPIMVRPLAVPAGDVRYEVVFGHRRHRACLELGLPVSAVVEDMDDRRLWATMERENRNRENLSPHEQGMMYLNALNGGLFRNQVELAKAIGRAPADVSNAIAIANLPAPVKDAFSSVNDVRFRDAKPLKDAVAQAPEAVAEAAKALAQDPAPRSAQQVVEALAQAANQKIRPSNSPRKGAEQDAPAPTARLSNTPRVQPPAALVRWNLDTKAGAMREAKKGDFVRWADLQALLKAKGIKL